MDIIVKGRHTGVSDRFRDQVTTKLARIERLDNKLIRVDVEVSKERNPRIASQRERVELTIHSRGPAIRAEASADDRFAALDMALDKLEGRLRRLVRPAQGAPRQPRPALRGGDHRDASRRCRRPRRGRGRGRTPEFDEEDELPDDKQYDDIVPIEMEGDGPLIVREKHHKAEPMTIDQALLEMELVGHDFYLFRDKESGQPCVVYNRRGYNYGVLRLVEP